MKHSQFNRITVDPNICFGKPCIRGMRMPVSSILDYLSSGMTYEQLLSEFPLDMLRTRESCAHILALSQLFAGILCMQKREKV